MKAFAVKHLAYEHGPLSKILPEVEKQPYSLTSKQHEANEAAQGNFVYVIEVVREDGSTIYRLGYKYRSTDVHKRAGGALWEGVFIYKNTVRYGEASDGMYFDSPVEITDSEFYDWFRGETLGMTHIPDDLVGVLDAIFADPKNHAKPFKR
ncbi:hypothetical protein FHR99_003232 [Litorivivens lipolytica]|uniref:Uncharacterized protein n=1 Tax=Litorivivens lipolytica TaxID=1524264 RepID=A0A7W4W8J1_9GAMM|nr:hypothetical protein [Litorivivens lipolytica]MBB3048958.1 hypothetical protein [Litorivivens lipolytica]